ncbi:TonB-dependent receptor [Zhongshania aquimaris]|uniref:TonB-dependent receptor n=1 Tax=Zhongshania aquimaris TaxID=2857107 RepID=A0ABS6VU33_9GAMM|nr:TonB-dependent receptor [Zhongshania aquimaris]MBW2941839.1 TonB-dependent receptor [Zhongshania aquimaris]
MPAHLSGHRITKHALSVLLLSAGISPLLSYAQSEQKGDEKAVEEVLVSADGSQVLLLEAYPGGQVARGGRAGILGNLDMMDAPFTSSNFTNALIRDQQASSVADVLQNDPVVRVAKGFGNFQEVYIIRGFPIYSDDMTYNGLYGILPRQFVAAELLERVEVFRGANTFLNGASPGGSGVGGLVNLVPKRAQEEDLNLLTTGFTVGGEAYLAADIARRFGENQENGLRLNIVKRDGESGIRDQDRDLSVLAVGFDHEGENLRVSADMGFQDHRIDSPRPSVTPLGDIPKAPESDTNFAQPWTYTDEKQLFAVARAEYSLSASTELWAALGTRQGEEDNILSNPDAVDDSGLTSAYRFDNTREDSIYSTEIGMRTEFNTGDIGHRLILSASAYTLESKNAYAFSNFGGFAGSIYTPTTVSPPVADAFVGGELNSPKVTQETDTSSIAIADMMSFMADRLLITVGARYQKIENSNYNYNTGALNSDGKYSENAITPVLGIVYKASESLSLYGNYSEALLPGEIAPATALNNPGEALDPYRSSQIETGLKYDGGNIGGSVSIFTVEKPSGITQNNTFSDNGEQRNQGLELTVFGQAAENLRLLGGLTLIDSEQVNTATGATNGKEFVGVPKLQSNINVEWDVPNATGLTLDARAVYTSKQYTDAANSKEISSWTRLDAGARFNTTMAGKEVTLRGRVENLTNRNYWASVGGFPGSNYLVLGSPRNLVFSASVAF